jgi:hypothetical protein
VCDGGEEKGKGETARRYVEIFFRKAVLAVLAKGRAGGQVRASQVHLVSGRRYHAAGQVHAAERGRGRDAGDTRQAQRVRTAQAERRQVSPSFGVPGCATSEYRCLKYPAAPWSTAVKVYCVPACDLIFWNASKLSGALEAANGRLDAPIRQVRFGGFLCCHGACSPSVHHPIPCKKHQARRGPGRDA